MSKTKKTEKPVSAFIGFRISKEVLEYIDDVAEKEDRTRSKVASILLKFAVAAKKGASNG